MTLAQLAAAHGVATSYEDWSGTPVPVAPTAVVAALAALGVDADGGEALVRALEDVCGLARRDVLMLLIREFTRPKMPVPASVWLNFAAEFNEKASPGVGEAALTRLLQSGPAKLASWSAAAMHFTGSERPTPRGSKPTMSNLSVISEGRPPSAAPKVR